MALQKPHWNLQTIPERKKDGNISLYVKKLPGKHMQFSLNDIARLQATANYWTKTSTTDFSGSDHKAKDVLKFQKFKKPLQNCLFFSNATGLQSRIYGFNKRDSKKKCFLIVFWTRWKYAKKRSVTESFYQGNKITI